MAYVLLLLVLLLLLAVGLWQGRCCRQGDQPLLN